MRFTRTVVLGIAAWLAVVAVGSTLVWAVISRVGDDVTATTSTPVVTPTDKRTPSATPRPDPTKTGGPDGPAAGVRRTWQGVGGSLVASCDGDAVRLVTTTPDLGYAFDVEDSGPDLVKVEFEGREEDEGRKVTVEAVCVAGVPEFTVETDETDD